MISIFRLIRIVSIGIVTALISIIILFVFIEFIRDIRLYLKSVKPLNDDIDALKIRMKNRLDMASRFFDFEGKIPQHYRFFDMIRNKRKFLETIRNDGEMVRQFIDELLLAERIIKSKTMIADMIIEKMNDGDIEESDGKIDLFYITDPSKCERSVQKERDRILTYGKKHLEYLHAKF